MADEIKNIEATEQVESGDNVSDVASYIDAINTMKATTVSKAEYQKLQAENQELLKALVNGEYIELPEKEPDVDVDALRSELYFEDKEFSNLEYVTKTLQLRDALIARGEMDPFLPIGSKISPTAEDIATAEKVAEVYRECIEYADGNSEIFTNELMRRTADVPLPRKTNRR